MAALHSEVPVTSISNRISPKFEIGGHTMAYDIKQSGERIRQFRVQSGYTQEKLAGVLNIDRSLLSHIEAGKRGCSIDLLIQLADFFGVSLDLLVLGKENAVSGESKRKLLKSDLTKLIERLEMFKESL